MAFTCWEKTEGLQKGGAPLVRDGFLFHTAKETSFFIFSTVSSMTELTSGRCENSKEVTCNLPGVLFRKKDFRVVPPKRFCQKFWNNVFWMANKKKRSILFSRFVAVVFSVRKIPLRPSNPSSSHSKDNVFWVHVRFLWHKTEEAQTKPFHCYVSGKIRIFRRAVPRLQKSAELPLICARDTSSVCAVDNSRGFMFTI